MKGKGILLNNLDVRICEKYALTITEAAVYFGIGEKTLRSMIKKYKFRDCVLVIGNKHTIKREMFAKFLDNETEIWKREKAKDPTDDICINT